jgi:hypothetical protein
MARRTVTFEWHIVEDGQDWAQLAAGHATPAQPRQSALDSDRWLLAQFLRVLTLSLVAVMLVTSAALTPLDRERLHLSGAIYASLALEAKAWQTNDHRLFNRLLDPEVGSEWQREWGDWGVVDPKTGAEPKAQLLSVASVGDIALAEVLISQPTSQWLQTSPYRESRFYKESTQGWLRTTPSHAFWGERQVKETAHLRFEYWTRDAGALEPSVAQLETLYLALYQMLQLEPPATSPKLTFVITPDLIRGVGGTGDRLAVTSPLMSKVPADLSATGYLSQTIVSRMTYRALMGMIIDQQPGDSYSYQWRTLQRAIRGWLRTTLLGQPGPWDLQAEAIFRFHLQEHIPLQLKTLITNGKIPFDDRDYSMWQYAAAESVVDYAVATYGQKRLPALLHGLRADEAWDDLIPSVFGASVADFEQGWNRYLAEKYR